MADVRAFRAFRYDLGRVGALSDVVAPPYDVIDPALQQSLYERSPHNVIRLFLVQDEADDVMGTTLVERLLQGGIDHIVRRGHDVAQGADAAKVVAKCAKRANICHDGPSFQPDSEFAILLSGGA